MGLARPGLGSPLRADTTHHGALEGPPAAGSPRPLSKSPFPAPPPPPRSLCLPVPLGSTAGFLPLPAVSLLPWTQGFIPQTGSPRASWMSPAQQRLLWNSSTSSARALITTPFVLPAETWSPLHGVPRPAPYCWGRATPWTMASVPRALGVCDLVNKTQDSQLNTHRREAVNTLWRKCPTQHLAHTYTEEASLPA